MRILKHCNEFKRQQETASFKICASGLECEAVQPEKSTNILQHSPFLYITCEMLLLIANCHILFYHSTEMLA